MRELVGDLFLNTCAIHPYIPAMSNMHLSAASIETLLRTNEHCDYLHMSTCYK